MELLVSNETQFCQSHMWFKHGEKLEHIVANHDSPKVVRLSQSSMTLFLFIKYIH